jgi:hypothetical protein
MGKMGFDAFRKRRYFRMNQESGGNGINVKRKQTFSERINTPLTVLTLAVISWIALEFVDFKVAIATIKQRIETMESKLIDHDEETGAMLRRNSSDHHRPNMFPCNGCHMKISGKEK